MDALLAVRIAKAVAEIALMCFAGRGLLALVCMSGRRERGTNPIHRLFIATTQPFVLLARLAAPRAVLERHLPLAACALLAMAWVSLTLGKVELCAKAPSRSGCGALLARRGAPPAAPGNSQ